MNKPEIGSSPLRNSEKLDLNELLARKLEALFHEVREREKVFAILNTHGIEKRGREPERVKSTILKLSGRDLKRIQIYTDYAKQDFRDIISWAECSRQRKNWSLPDGPKKQRLIEANRAEYEQWLFQKCRLPVTLLDTASSTND